MLDPSKGPHKGPHAADAFTHEREALHRQMLSAVSHDLKTPLASVIGSIEIFRRMGAQLSDKQREELLKTALTEAYRLDSFLTNILDLAKLENNLVPIRKEPTDLHHLIEDMVAGLGARRGDAVVAVKGPAGVTINTDATLLSRAINLLVDNGIKHAGQAPRIDITYDRPNGDKLTISIKDDGPGIPIDKHEEIFSKYTRLQRGDMQNAGTGLGLNIARIIAQRLGGDLNIVPHASGESGAHFDLTLRS
jgi:K+-sensing histidine kinase KdpD